MPESFTWVAGRAGFEPQNDGVLDAFGSDLHLLADLELVADLLPRRLGDRPENWSNYVCSKLFAICPI